MRDRNDPAGRGGSRGAGERAIAVLIVAVIAVLGVKPVEADYATEAERVRAANQAFYQAFSGGSVARSLRSAPAQKAFSPEPVIITTRMSALNR